MRVIVGQVGDYLEEKQTWNRPEDIETPRSIYLISMDHPGTELSAEMAASLAASSIVFKRAQSKSFREA